MENFDWLMPNNYKEPPLVRLALDTLTNEEDQILNDWIKIVFPYILDYFSLRNAKGTSFQVAEVLTADLDIPLEKRQKIINKLVNKSRLKIFLVFMN
jgi:CRISPR-associated protein Csc3